MPRRIRRSLIVLPAAIAIVGCDGTPTGPGGTGPIESLPRALTPSEQQVVASSNSFTFDLLGRVLADDEGPNVVLSPFSASMALGMTLNGAAGTTFEGMRSALRFDGLTQGEINESYRGLVELLLNLDPSVELSIGNATWANEAWAFHPSFFDSLATYFDAQAESRDFADPSTVAEINAWAEERTDGRIDRILDELDPDLAMILLNAIWFEGTWTSQFDPERTEPAAFRRSDGSDVMVEMMNLSDVELRFGTASVDPETHLSVVELPYGGGAWTMVVAVPLQEVSIREIAAGLDASDWDALTGSLSEHTVDRVALPRFTLTYDVFLNDALREMGMAVAFTDDADFTNLSPDGDHLCLDFVRQKTFIDVDEAGTRAGAVTAVGVGPDSFTGLIADRPFLVAIRERLSGTILFVGVVGDPTAQDSGEAEPQDGCLPA